MRSVVNFACHKTLSKGQLIDRCKNAPRVQSLRRWSTCQVDEGPADVDVGADVVRLHLDCAPEVGEGLAEPRLRLEGVADVVEELRVARVHLETGLK